MRTECQYESFDKRSTLSRSDAREVYNKFAEEGKLGGKDAESGYGGPAVNALLDMANFTSAENVLEYGCGQGKLCELVLSKILDKNDDKTISNLNWRGIDQSPRMVERFQERCVRKFGSQNCKIELLESGDPNDVHVEKSSVDRFVSTYCLDLMSEEDMYRVLDLAAKSLDKEKGLLLLAGITWGYRSNSLQTFLMTGIWEFLYRVNRRKVGGCRPQHLKPYLESRGWRVIKSVETMPAGFPWMVSEVISARPPLALSSEK